MQVKSIAECSLLTFIKITFVFKTFVLSFLRGLFRHVSLYYQRSKNIKGLRLCVVQIFGGTNLQKSIDFLLYPFTGPRSAVGSVYGYRCVSDCNSRGREFDPGPVPYFRGDWSWNNFYGHSPPFLWFIQEGLLSVTSESMCTNYWLSACSSLPRKKCGYVNWPSRNDHRRKATKPTNNQQPTISLNCISKWSVWELIVLYVHMLLYKNEIKV